MDYITFDISLCNTHRIFCSLFILTLLASYTISFIYPSISCMEDDIFYCHDMFLNFGYTPSSYITPVIYIPCMFACITCCLGIVQHVRLSNVMGSLYIFKKILYNMVFSSYAMLSIFVTPLDTDYMISFYLYIFQIVIMIVSICLFNCFLMWYCLTIYQNGTTSRSLSYILYTYIVCSTLLTMSKITFLVSTFLNRDTFVLHFTIPLDISWIICSFVVPMLIVRTLQTYEGSLLKLSLRVSYP